jgi:transcriptional regulator with XRE-family HTH domain
MTAYDVDRFAHPGEAQLAHQIRVELVERGMDQGELADLAGVGRPALSRYMQGHRSMRMDTFIRIAVALGINPSDLLERAARPR